MQSPLLHSNSVAEQLVLCLPQRLGSDRSIVLPGKHSQETYFFRTKWIQLEMGKLARMPVGYFILLCRIHPVDRDLRIHR